jgi:hypothetical protein
MNPPLRKLASLASIAALAVVAAPCAGANAASASTAPLPASDYTVRGACQAPSVGRASCMAEQLVPVTAAARAHNHPIGVVRPAGAAQPALSPTAGDFGYRPADVHSAYSLPATGGGEPILALIDAYHYLTAKEDLKNYEETFKLSGCKVSCFRQVNQKGGETPPFPKSAKELKEFEKGTLAQQRQAEAASGWAIEEALDIEAARASCPNCRLVLVEAKSSNYSDLEEAVRAAQTLGAQVISNSWGGPEEGVTSDATFNDPNVVITASSGDNGYLGWDAETEEEGGFTSYPASSPHVVAVGGTQLRLGAGGAWKSETVWNGSGASGGGCSEVFAAPEWQTLSAQWPNVGCEGKRSVVDVAAVGDPYTGIAVTATSPLCEYEEAKVVVHWCTYGGTSLASPVIAGVFALAGGANGVAYPAKTLYESRRHAPGTLHDVTVGSNGICNNGVSAEGIHECTAAEEASASCEGQLTCLAGKGYDGPSGVGTPNGITGFQPGAVEAGVEEEPVEKRKTPPNEKAAEKPSEKPAPSGASTTPSPPTVPPPAAPAQPPGAGATLSKAVAISRLMLTNAALKALNRHRPAIAKVGFSFELSRGTGLRATLARKVRVHGRTRWIAVGRAPTMNGVAGRNQRRLSGGTRLKRGVYRLTLASSGGSAQSLLIHIG